MSEISEAGAEVSRVRVKRRDLSEFLIKMKGSDGSVVGEITSVYWGKSQGFTDVNEIISIIEKHCDSVKHPQAQRKARDWS